MARRITNGRHSSGHPLKGKPIASGGPGFIGAPGSSPTVMAGSRKGGRKQVKTRSGTQPGRGPVG